MGQEHSTSGVVSRHGSVGCAVMNGQEAEWSSGLSLGLPWALPSLGDPG